MYFITTKRMLEVCFSVHPNIQYRTTKYKVYSVYNKPMLDTKESSTLTQTTIRESLV